MKNSLPILLISFFLVAGCLAPNLEKTQNKSQVVDTMTQTLIKQHSDFSYLSVNDLLKLSEQEKDFILIDARTNEEREISMIGAALTTEQWDTSSATADKNSLIVIYDTLGYRSIDLIKKLQKNGFHNVHYLAGGVLAWAHAEQLFYSNGLTTRRVHVSSKAWNLLPESYEAVHD